MNDNGYISDWIDEFINLLLKGDDHSIIKAFHIKDGHIPNSLFRYRSYNKYTRMEIID